MASCDVVGRKWFTQEQPAGKPGHVMMYNLSDCKFFNQYHVGEKGHIDVAPRFARRPTLFCAGADALFARSPGIRSVGVAPTPTPTLSWPAASELGKTRGKPGRPREQRSFFPRGGRVAVITRGKGPHEKPKPRGEI